MPENEEKTGIRLDLYVAETLGVTRSRAQSLIEDGCVTVNGGREPKNYKIKPGDEISCDEPESFPCEAKPEDIPLDVVYEDSDIIVVNKRSGMVVHPAPGNETGTLVNALLFHCGGELSGINGVIRPGIVHRIDKDTSGLIVAAKNNAAHLFLSAQLKGHNIKRTYHAIVVGHFREPSGTVDAPIGRNPADRKKMAVIRDTQSFTSREAVTHYFALEELPGFTYAKMELETGRTHQIRVHMSYIGHPIIGDTVYGGGKTVFEKKHASLLDGQCLHAKELSFIHPSGGELMKFECPLPENFEKILGLLRKI